MNCPRCGGHRTERKLRKEGKKVTNLMEEWCRDCGWYGNHIHNPPVFEQEPEPELPREDEAGSYLFW